MLRKFLAVRTALDLENVHVVLGLVNPTRVYSGLKFHTTSGLYCFGLGFLGLGCPAVCCLFSTFQLRSRGGVATGGTRSV